MIPFGYAQTLKMDENQRSTPVAVETSVPQVTPTPVPMPVPMLQVPPSPPSTELPKSGIKLPPLKFLLIGVGALVVLGLAGFLVQKFFLSKPTEAEVTLTYWGLEEKSVIDGAIKEYEAKNPNTKIQYVKQAKVDYRERLVNSLAKNSGPDIFHFHATWVQMMSSHLGSAPPQVFDAASMSRTFPPVVVHDLVRAGAPVGVPLGIDGLGLYINETIFNTSLQLVPDNWDDLRLVAQNLTKKDEQGRIQQSGVALGQTVNVDHWQDILSLMLLQNKADLANPAGSLASDPVLYFASFAQGSTSTWDDTLPPSTQAFARGNVAMYFGPSWRAREIKLANPNLAFRIVPVPQLPKNNPGDPDVTFASYWAEGVWSKTKNSDAAWSFLKFMAEKPTLEKLYAAQVAAWGYGNPYPRTDMAGALENDPIVGAYLRQAPSSKSSYLVSDTNDGVTGVNSKLSVIWKGVVDAIIKESGRVEELLPEAALQIQQVLASYSGAP